MVNNCDVENWRLSDTDTFIKYGEAFVPRRDEQINSICRLLRDIPVPRVLDLCAGEGRLSEAYLRCTPNGHATVLDKCVEMLNISARRLESFAGRCVFLQENLEERTWRNSDSYGGVMTSLAVHHLDGAGKKVLYRDIHEMLVPGGVFAMVDLIEPTGANARKLAGDHWEEAVQRASQLQFGSDEAAAAFACTEWNYYRLATPDPIDKPSSIAEHIDWLRDAGFIEIDVVWLYAGHAVFAAKRRK